MQGPNAPPQNDTDINEIFALLVFSLHPGIFRPKNAL